MKPDYFAGFIVVLILFSSGAFATTLITDGNQTDSLTMSSQSQGRPSLTITGVTDINSIDQSNTGTSNDWLYMGKTTLGFNNGEKFAVKFIPTKSKLTKVTLNIYKVGNPTDNIIVTIQTDNTGSPSGTILAQASLAGTSLTGSEAEYEFSVPAILTIGNSYWITYGRDGATSDTDYYAITAHDSLDHYNKLLSGGTWYEINFDSYIKFKTMFAKLTSSVDLNVVASDETSDLQKYNVNGSLFHDANIMINPNGTGTYKWQLGRYVAGLFGGGFEVENVSPNLESYQLSYVVSGSQLLNGGSDYKEYKIVLPNGCTLNGLGIQTEEGYFTTGETLGVQIAGINKSYEDFFNWDAITQDEPSGWNYTTSLDGQNTFYIKIDANGTGSQFGAYPQIDANINCAITTPLFKAGNNTVYTFNKNAFTELFDYNSTEYRSTQEAYKKYATFTLELPMFISSITNQIKETTSGTNTTKYVLNFSDGTNEDTSEETTTSSSYSAKTYTVTTQDKFVTSIELWMKHSTSATHSYAKDTNIIYNYTPFTNLPSLQSNLTFIEQAKISFYDENSGLLLAGVNTNFNGTNYPSGTDTNINFSISGLTIGNEYTLTFSKTGYTNRTYNFTAGQLNFLDINFALLPTTLGNTLTYRIYQTDGNTLLPNTYFQINRVNVANGTAIIGRTKTDTSALTTMFTNVYDQNYTELIGDTNIYSMVGLSVLYPKNEQSYIQIGNLWRVDISQNFYAQYLNLDANLVVFLLPNTLLPFNVRVGDMNGDYFYRSYTKQYPGNPLTEVLQPYLVPYEDGLGTVLRTIQAYTNIPYPNIIIKVYKLSSVTGRTFVESITTDSKGEGFVLMTVGEDYEFELYYGATNEYIRTDKINTVSSLIELPIPLPGQDVDVTQTTNYYTVNTKFIPNIGKLLFTTTALTQTITLTNVGANTDTLSSIKIWVSNNDVNVYSKTFATTAKTYTNSIDINTISKVIDGNAYDGNYTLIVYVQVTTSTGAVTITKWVYSPPKTYDLVKGFGADLKGFVGCANSNDPLIPCPTLLIAALFLSLILTIGFATETGFSSMEGMGVVFLVIMAIFTYLTWVPYLLYGLMILATIALAAAIGGNKI